MFRRSTGSWSSVALLGLGGRVVAQVAFEAGEQPLELPVGQVRRHAELAHRDDGLGGQVKLDQQPPQCRRAFDNAGEPGSQLRLHVEPHSYLSSRLGSMETNAKSKKHKG